MFSKFKTTAPHPSLRDTLSPRSEGKVTTFRGAIRLYFVVMLQFFAMRLGNSSS